MSIMKLQTKEYNFDMLYVYIYLSIKETTCYVLWSQNDTIFSSFIIAWD